ncbi:hypothetical protein REPUB_Repub17cG0197000 [Reevesia pubescens]
MRELAISMSRESFTSRGWPIISPYGLDEAAQRCLYTTISEQIQIAMEGLRNDCWSASSRNSEDDKVVAFQDIKPAAFRHYLVISVEHIPTFLAFCCYYSLLFLSEIFKEERRNTEMHLSQINAGLTSRDCASISLLGFHKISLPLHLHYLCYPRLIRDIRFRQHHKRELRREKQRKGLANGGTRFCHFRPFLVCQHRFRHGNPKALSFFIGKILECEMQKEVFKAVKIDTRQPPYVFKCLLYYLTGVPPERQKIMVKGGLLKDDADWSSVGVKQVKDLDIFKAPEKGTVFIEDLPEEEQLVALALPQQSADNHLWTAPEHELVCRIQLYIHYSTSQEENNLKKLLEVVATYDFLLEVAMKIQHVQQTWKWLVDGFASYYGVSDAYTKLRYGDAVGSFKLLSFVQFSFQLQIPFLCHGYGYTEDCLTLIYDLLSPVKSNSKHKLSHQKIASSIKSEQVLIHLLQTTLILVSLDVLIHPLIYKSLTKMFFNFHRNFDLVQMQSPCNCHLDALISLNTVVNSPFASNSHSC